MRISIFRWRWLLIVVCVLGLVVLSGWWLRYSKSSARDAAARECRTLRAAKQWKRLAEVARRWSEWDADNADPWLYRAESAEEMREAVSTAEYLSRVPEKDPRAALALVKLATLQFEVLNHPREGEKTCERILRINPKVTQAHGQLIFYALSTLQRQELIRRIRAAIRVRRESPECYVFLAGTHWLYPANLYRLNTHWLKSEPDSEMYQVARAMQVYTSNAKTNPERAAEFEDIPTAEELLRKFPHNTEVLAYHLENRIEDGDVEVVEKLLKASDPTTLHDARFWRAKAWLQDTNGDSEAAEASLKRALEIDPYWWKLHFQLMEIYRRYQRSDEFGRMSEIYEKSKRLSKIITTLDDGKSPGSEFYDLMLFLAIASGDDLVANALRFRQQQQ